MKSLVIAMFCLLVAGHGCAAEADVTRVSYDNLAKVYIVYISLS